MKYRKKTPPPPTYPKLSISTLVLTALCVFAIVIATFKQFHFEYINPLEFLTKSTFPHQSLTYYAQIPIVLFIGAFLGSNFGLLAILGYIFTGLFIAPVFGLGGGLNYVLQPSFGYILGYMFGVYFVGKNLENNRSPLALLSEEKRTELLNIQKHCNYLELSGNGTFNRLFPEHMTFDKEESPWN